MKKIILLLLTVGMLVQCSTSDNGGNQNQQEQNDTNNEEEEEEEDPTDDGSGQNTGLCDGGTITTPVNINSQQELEDWAANNYTRAEDGLSLFQVTDLSPLSCLEYVAQLTIVSSQITDLNGLESLTEVGNFFLDDCDNLTNLEGLNNLSMVEKFWIIRNDNLENLQGLDSFENVTELFITRNPSLQTLNGIESLTSLNLDPAPVAEAVVRIEENEVLTDISALNNIQGVFSSLDLGSCPNLTNFGVFDKVTSFDQSIYISNMAGLTSFDAFPNVESAFGILITINENLQSVNFPSLTELGLLRISNNDSFSTMEGFAALTQFTFGSDTFTSIDISSNPSLLTLDGLENLAFNASKVKINAGEFSPLTNVCALQLLVDNYILNGEDPVNQNSIEIRTECSAGEDLINDFANLCDCN